MKIRIQNFQAFSDVTLEATGLTVIVGPSNHGKSSLIRAVSAALFNKPGEDFVRTGHQTAKVTLTDLPSWDKAFLRVEWLKGHNTNRFVVDGDTYDKVGLSSPAVLFDAGYRDVWIGDRDRSKGEYIRPQVAGQFDRLFLLDRSGAFVSDVLSVISRLAVLLRAHQRSVSDLKSQKQVLGLRRKDLTAAQERLTTLLPIKDLYTRTTVLVARVEALAADRRRVEEDLSPRVARRQALQRVTTSTLPPVTIVPPDLGQTYFDVRLLLAARQAFQPLAQATIPDSHVGRALEVFVAADKCQAMAGLVEQRHRVQGLGTSTLPLAKLYPIVKLDQLMAHRLQLTRLVRDREAVSTHYFAVKTAARAAADELVQATAALDTCLASLDACPVCGQSMVGVTVA